MRFLLLIFAAVLIAPALGAGLRPAPGAEAHAFLRQSSPSAGQVVPSQPIEILFWFTEPIELEFSKAQVIDQEGNRWDNDDLHKHFDPFNPGLTVKLDMPDGTYTVVWNVLSAVDGHRTRGAFAFFIGEAAAAPPAVTPAEAEIDIGKGPPGWLYVAVRWINFAAMAALLGAALFPFTVLPAAARRLPPRDDGSNHPAEIRSLHLARLTVFIAAGVLIAGAILLLWMQAWSASGSGTSLSAFANVLSGTRFGDIWIVRMTLAVSAMLCGLQLLRQPLEPWSRSLLNFDNIAWALLIALALGLPLTTSLNSHAAAAENATIPTAVDFIHLTAAGGWIGGLAQLLLILAFVVPRLDERAAFLGGLVRRFSWIAAPSVALIVATGIYQAIQYLGGIDELVGSGYGFTLVVKALLLLPLLLFAAFNLLVAGPRFLSLARERGGKVVTALWERRFRSAVAGELALVAAILAVAAVLTNTSPPGPAAGGQSTIIQPPSAGFASGRADDLDIAVWADPGTPGALNDINILLTDLDGDKRPVQRVILRLTYQGDNLGTSEVFADPVHPPSHYVAFQVSQMSLPGEWEVEVIVRREGLLDVRTAVTLDL
jgi:copper transport protein